MATNFGLCKVQEVYHQLRKCLLLKKDLLQGQEGGCLLSVCKSGSQLVKLGSYLAGCNSRTWLRGRQACHALKKGARQ